MNTLELVSSADRDNSVKIIKIRCSKCGYEPDRSFGLLMNRTYSITVEEYVNRLNKRLNHRCVRNHE